MINIPDSIFPKDPQGNLLCPRCLKTLPLCSCPSIPSVPLKKVKLAPHIRLDKNGRKGKMVTLISGLPRNPEELKNIARALKVKTGSGGTSYIDANGGVVEIQGDHLSVVQAWFHDQNSRKIRD